MNIRKNKVLANISELMEGGYPFIGQSTYQTESCPLPEEREEEENHPYHTLSHDMRKSFINSSS